MTYISDKTSPTVGSVLQTILITCCLCLFCALFFAIAFVHTEVNQRLKSSNQVESLITGHLLDVEQLRGTVAGLLTPTDQAYLQTVRADEIDQWQSIITPLETGHSKAERPLFLNAAFRAQPIDADEIKLLHSELKLAIADLAGQSGSDQDTTESPAHHLAGLLANYSQTVTPLLQQRLTDLEALNKRYSQSLGLLLFLFSLSMAGLFLTGVWVLIAYSQSKKSKLAIQLLFNRSLSQLHSGVLLLNEQLEVEYADLGKMGLNVTEMFNEPTAFDALLFDYFDTSDLRSLKPALKKLLGTATRPASVHERIEHTVNAEIDGQPRRIAVIASCIKLKGKTKIVTTWNLHPSPLEEMMSITLPNKALPKDVSALNAQPPLEVNAIQPATEKSVFEDQGVSAQTSKGPNKPADIAPVPAEKERQEEATRLKKEFKRKLQRIELVTKLDPYIAGEFFQDTRQLMRTSKMRVSALAQGKADEVAVRNHLMQALHQIKGDAAILGLDEFAQVIHKLESGLSALPTSPHEEKHSIQKYLEQFDQGIRHFESLYKLFLRFTSYSEDEQEDGSTHLITYLQQYANRIASDSGKKVRLIDDQISGSAIPESLNNPIMSLLSQLVRNAVIHGIEDPATRQRLRKTDYGLIHIALKREQDSIAIEFRDDGKGVQIPKILAKARLLGDRAPDPTQPITSELLFDILATPGVTTEQEASEHAGRGVGLDVVNNTIKKLGGTIRLETKPGQFTLFTLSIPVKPTAPEGKIPTLSLETHALTTA